MSPSLEALYPFALDERVSAYLGDPQYRALMDRAEKQEELLRAALDSDQRLHFSCWKRDFKAAQSLEAEAAFQAGLSLGLEPGRA